MIISFNNLHVEQTVTFIAPDGYDLMTTNNPNAILFARSSIKRNKLDGYKIRTENGDVYEIDHYGRINGEIHGDIAESLLCELL